MNSNNKRIVKNSIFLLSRTVFLTLVTLYTLREVMSILGAEEFGLYTVVFGVVAMFSFLNSTMMSATQRFLSIAIGKNEIEEIKNNFYCSFFIHVFLSIFLITIIYLLKDYLLNDILNINGYQKEASLIYNFAIFSIFISLLQVPFSALITAYEKMQAFAYLAIFEGLAKLMVVYFLVFFDYDKVITYSLCLTVITFFVFIINMLYCYVNFKEVLNNFSFKIQKIKLMFSKMLNFIGWSLIGNLSIVMRNQGSNILLNIYFGLIVNTAFAISLTVMGAISALVASVSNAINPQVFKLYAKGSLDKFYNLILNGTKYYIYFLSLIITPIIFYMELILNIWLSEYPLYTVLFCQLMLILVVIDSFSILLTTGIQANGNVKFNQIVTGVLLCLPIPVTYYLFEIDFPVGTILYVFLVSSFLSIFTKLYFICRLTDFVFLKYINKVLLPGLMIIIFNFVLMYILINIIKTSYDFFDIILCFMLFYLLSPFAIFLVGLSSEEKISLKNIFFKKLGKNFS